LPAPGGDGRQASPFRCAAGRRRKARDRAARAADGQDRACLGRARRGRHRPAARQPRSHAACPFRPV